MNKHVSRGIYLALFVGGLTALGTTAANAAETTGDDGILSGTQAGISLSAPVEIVGNSLSILGDSQSNAAPVAPAPAAPAPAAPAPAAPAPVASTSGSDGVASGTQAVVDVSIPVTIGGNAISVLGDSQSNSAATPTAAAPVAPAPAVTTTGTDSLLGGTQGLIGLDVPVTIGGNAVSVIGDSQSTGSTTTAPTGTTGTGTGSSTTGDDSILGGTQIVPTVGLPITAGGNAVSVIGDSQSTGSTTTAPSASGADGAVAGGTTTGSDSILGGTQIVPTVGLPITIGGNAVSVIGDSQSTGSTTTAPTGTTGTGTGSTTTTGDDGILGGTQIVPTVGLPITIGGNAVSVIGDSQSTGSTTGTPVVTPIDPTDPTDPTDPVIPTTPTDTELPSDPSTPAVIVPTSSSVDGGTSTTTTAGADNETRLAFTGGTDGGLSGWFGALALLAGLGLMIAGRRRVRA